MSNYKLKQALSRLKSANRRFQSDMRRAERQLRTAQRKLKNAATNPQVSIRCTCGYTSKRSIHNLPECCPSCGTHIIY